MGAMRTTHTRACAFREQLTALDDDARTLCALPSWQLYNRNVGARFRVCRAGSVPLLVYRQPTRFSQAGRTQ